MEGTRKIIVDLATSTRDKLDQIQINNRDKYLKNTITRLIDSEYDRLNLGREENVREN